MSKRLIQDRGPVTDATGLFHRLPSSLLGRFNLITQYSSLITHHFRLIVSESGIAGVAAALQFQVRSLPGWPARSGRSLSFLPVSSAVEPH